VGPHVIMHFAPPLAWFDNVILASKMEVLRAWSSVFYASIPGGVPRNTSGLATIGSDFIKLMNTNKTP
jgi:hypothetical protein